MPCEKKCVSTAANAVPIVKRSHRHRSHAARRPESWRSGPVCETMFARVVDGLASHRGGAHVCHGALLAGVVPFPLERSAR